MSSKAQPGQAPWFNFRQKGRAAILAALPGLLIIAISLTRTLISSEIYQLHERIKNKLYEESMLVSLLGLYVTNQILRGYIQRKSSLNGKSRNYPAAIGN